MLKPPAILDAAAIQRLTNPAAMFYEHLIKQIQKFEQALKAGEIVLLKHPMAGDVLDVRAIGFQGPDMIVLRGVDSKDRASWLVMHMSAAQLTLQSIAPQRDERRRQIGFLGQVEKEENGSAE
jgi:hypothetical protein